MVLAFRTLSETITASSFSTNETFPFVTVPMFEVQGQHARQQSGIEIFAYTPLVKESQRDEWQAYSNTHQGWIQESRRQVLGGGGTLKSSSYLDVPIAPFLWQRDKDGNPVPASGSDPFAPIWQTSPPPFTPQFVNYNMFAESFIATMYHVVATTKGKSCKLRH